MRENWNHRFTFYRFLNKELSASDFEKWIYDNPDIESGLGTDLYMDLISYNFTSRDLIPYIEGIVEKCFDLLEFEKWRTIRLLTDIKDGNVEIVLATRKLREIYLEQEDKIGKSFLSMTLAIGYESELDSCPIESEYHLYNKLSLLSMLEPVEWYKTDILEMVELELQELKNPDCKRIDLKSIDSIDHLHDTFKERLNFPDFYGKNWDAFWDSITGLVEMPKVLTLNNWSKFEKKFKRDSKILNELINDYNNESSEKQIVITKAGDKS